MKNSSFYMAIVMMAFLISCGKPKEQENNNNNGPRLFETITLSKLKPVLNEELELIKSACSGLSIKEENLKLMANQVTLNFKSEIKNCTSSSVNKSSASAVVRHQGSNLYYEKSSGTGYIFSDIILRNSSDMKEFCDKAQTNSLNGRDIILGNKVKIISSQRTNDGVQIVISTGFLNNDSNYDIKLTDEFIILTNNTSSNGFVSKRLLRNGIMCTGNNIYSAYVELQ